MRPVVRYTQRLVRRRDAPIEIDDRPDEKVTVNVLRGRIGNATATVEVATVPGYERRMLQARLVVLGRLLYPHTVVR